MENLTNEQIIEIINFYNMCGISEDIYLSSNGVLDLFTLLGIRPEYDDEGNRLPTVYEQLGIAPKFVNGKEVPIVFAIKHSTSKINKNQVMKDVKFTYLDKKDKEKDDKVILKKLRQDYFEAVVNGNMIEATRLYDMIDMLTGGKADYFIGVQYNAVKFYKKMQKQLLIDMFANFVILMVLSKKQNDKQGIFRFDKLYKVFIEKQLTNSELGISQSSKAPVVNSVSVEVSDDLQVKKIDIKATAKSQQSSEFKADSSVLNEQDKQDMKSFVSLVKAKVTNKINKIRDNLIKKNNSEKNINVKSGFNKSEKMFNILEND